MLNISDLTAIKDALEEVYTDGINAIVSVDVDEDDRLFGVFRDGKKLYDFTLDPEASSPAEQVFYTLQNPDVISKNDADIDWQWEMKNDAYVFVFPERWRIDKAKNCTKGTACGGTCIPATKTCRAKEGLSEGSKTKLKGVKEKISKSAKVGDLTRKEMQDAVLKEFGAKSLKELASNSRFKMLTQKEKGGNYNGRDLQQTNNLANVYRRMVGVIPNDPVNKPGTRGVINGINALYYTDPTKIFGIDWATSTPEDLEKAYRKINRGIKNTDTELYLRLADIKEVTSKMLEGNRRKK